MSAHRDCNSPWRPKRHILITVGAVAALFSGELLNPLPTYAEILFGAPFLSFNLRGPARAIVAGDLDGDGRPDLAIANSDIFQSAATSLVSVLCAGPDGGFGDRFDTPVGRGPVAIVAADFNQDGRLDLVTANQDAYPATLSLLTGFGDGTFAPASDVPGPIYPLSLASGDVNGDGNLDLAVGALGTSPSIGGYGIVAILLGRGNGTFVALPELRVGRLPDIALGDVNSDGKLDIVAANEYDSNVSTFLGNGDGTFGARQDFALGAAPASLLLTDLDRDGALDISTTDTWSGTVSVLRGNGDGDFEAERAFGAGAYPSGLAVTDMNEDGHFDLLVTTDGYDSMSVLLGRGDGTFGAARAVLSGPRPTFAAIGDFNLDGHQDVAVGGGVPAVAVLTGNGDGTFGAGDAYEMNSAATSVALADLNRDGKSDFVASRWDSGGVSVRMGLGNGTFGPRTDFGTGGNPIHLAIGDLNADGRPDVATANYRYQYFSEGVISVLLGTGTGELTLPVQYGALSGPQAVAIGDFNGDDRQDVIAVSGDLSGACFAAALGAGRISSDASPAAPGTSRLAPGVSQQMEGENLLSLFPGEGDGSLGIPSEFGSGRAYAAVAIGDLNRDNRADLAVGLWDPRPAFGTVLVYFGLGEGAFGPPTQVASGVNPVGLAIGDLNRDTWPDLAVANASLCEYEGSVTVVLAAGSGLFGGSIDYPTEGATFSVGIGDLDGDGAPDLAAAANRSNTVSVLFGAGDGTFPRRSDFGCGGAPWSVAIGDVNRDGRSDLICANYRTRDVRVLLNLSGASLAFEARAFLRDRRAIPVGRGSARTCLYVEPADGSFSAGDIDPTSLTMSVAGSLSSGEIGVMVPKGFLLGDADRNGIPDLEVCFAREDISSLFTDIRGRRTVRVALDGSLTGSGRIHAELDLDLIGTGRRLAASVAPNPLNPAASLSFVTFKSGPAKVQIFDMQGRLVRILLDVPLLGAGEHEVVIDGRDGRGRALASGLYFYLVEADGASVTGRVAVLK